MVVALHCRDKDSDIIHLKDDFSKELENNVKQRITKEKIYQYQLHWHNS